MTTQHTPGPWYVMVDDNGIEPTICSVGGVTVGSPDHPEDAAEDAANARLIAAAPELLAALEAVVDAWSRPATPSGYGRNVSDVVWDLKQAMPQVSAALAKAKGQQHD